MKKVLRTFVNALAVAILAVCCLPFTACSDITTLNVNVKVYDFSSESYTNQTITVELYRHLAEKNVDAVIDSVNEGFYKNSVFYKLDGYSSQIMMGDIKSTGEGLTFKSGKDIVGEFTSNGVFGSDLKNAKGYIGMWRSWTVSGGGYTASDTGRDSATGTWFMPTGTISSYDGYFTVFAKIDLENSSNSKAFEAISAVFSSSENYDSYEVYYVLEGGNYVAHYMLKSEFTPNFNSETNVLTIDENSIQVVKAEKSELVKYNHYTINVPKTIEGTRAAVITSITVE